MDVGDVIALLGLVIAGGAAIVAVRANVTAREANAMAREANAIAEKGLPPQWSELEPMGGTTYRLRNQSSRVAIVERVEILPEQEGPERARYVGLPTRVEYGDVFTVDIFSVDMQPPERLRITWQWEDEPKLYYAERLIP